jgi:predicted metal-dependent phosphoesterase TrpH
LPVLAHPADISDLNDLMPELKSVGLIGLEVYYRDYSPEIVGKLVRLAQQYDLIPTGGTDYHAFGDASEVELGGAICPAGSIERLFDLASERGLELLKQH